VNGCVFNDWAAEESKRQPKKWIKNMNQDTDTRKIQFDEAMTIIHDRVKWRRLIAASSSFC